VHVAATSEDGLVAARAIAERAGGWLLRERGAPNLDGFGHALPNGALMARIKAGFDPDGKLSPGRMPLPAVDGDLERSGSRA
jgi:FAD/FMN-containing dehydrogenase